MDKKLEKVRAAADAELDFGIVDIKYLDVLRARSSLNVYQRSFRSGRGVIISEGFHMCQGVVLLDSRRGVGAIAHNYPSDDPYFFLTGKRAGECDGEIIEDPREIFPDTSKVKAVHVYHMNNYTWPELWVEEALGEIGVENIRHVPIKPKNGTKVFWRDIGLDTRNRTMYVFPNDLNYGLSLKL